MSDHDWKHTGGPEGTYSRCKKCGATMTPYDRFAGNPDCEDPNTQKKASKR